LKVKRHFCEGGAPAAGVKQSNAEAHLGNTMRSIAKYDRNFHDAQIPSSMHDRLEGNLEAGRRRRQLQE
jgi:hypothetical protein